MYSDDEKQKLMDDLKEMESLKVDTGSEGEILQKDLINYFTKNEGDKDELIFRIEMFFYAFKLFCRKTPKINRNEFTIFLNDSILEWEKINLIKPELDKFELVIEAVKDEKDVLINLNFTLHY